MSSHDISHCRGQECTKKNTCHRYLQHVELAKRKGIAPYLQAVDCIKEKHIAFWEHKSDAK